MLDWDKIVISVGTEQQKNFISKMLSEIDLDVKECITVINDDQFGCRIGSGGAFINIISKLYEPGRKMLIINSGGFSKRCFNYAIKGKLFGTFYYEGRKTTLFESLIAQTSKIADNISSGAVVCCSDILIDIKNTDFNDFSFEDNTGFCIRSPLDVCSRHGVFIGEDRKEAKLYAHKKSTEQLKKLTLSDSALVDTGFAYFSDAFLNKIYRITKENDLVEEIRKNKLELNLYSDIYPLLAEKNEEQDYLYSDLQNSAHLKIRRLLLSGLPSTRIRAFELNAEKFIHFGTTREAADNIRYLAEGKKVVQLNSALCNSEIKGRAVLENCILKNCVVGDNTFISDISLNDVCIPDNTLVCGVKTTTGKCAAVCCPIDENPKEVVNGISLWKTARFSLADTFTESFDSYFNGTDSRNFVSMDWITKNADIDYLCSLADYIESINNYNVSEEYIKRSNEITGNYFCEQKPLKKLELKRDFTELRLPVRLNLSGTWTDAAPYCVENGGQVINMSVKIDGKMPIYVSLKKLDRPVIQFVSDGRETVCDISELYDNSDDFDDFILHKAALKVLGVRAETLLQHGFCLKTQVNGIKKGSGLGVSSLLLLGCVTVFEKALGLSFDDAQKINMVFVAEQLMKTGGGWQDQICGLSYGLNDTTAEAGISQHAVIEKIPVSPDFQKVINDRFAVVYTGQRHYGRFIVYEIMNKYLEGDSKYKGVFDRLRKLNMPMREAFLNEDIKKIADLLNRQFDLLKELSGNITNKEIDRLVAECRAYADGVCICGAGAGGYLMLVLKENERFDALVKHLRDISVNDEITAARISFYTQ